MRTTRSLGATFPLLPALLVTGVLAAAPQPAAAADCGANYVACLNRTGAAGSSDALHEMKCYSEYWGCLKGRLMSY